MSTAASALAVETLTQEEVLRRAKDDQNYRYYVHGTSTGSWGTSKVIEARSQEKDFGPGFYVFDFNLRGILAAKDRARQKTSGLPFLLVVKISEDDYQSLNPWDLLDPLNEIIYDGVVRRGREENRSPPGRHAVRGPVATKNSFGRWAPDGKFPTQTSFDIVGVTKLKPVAVVPLFWWYR